MTTVNIIDGDGVLTAINALPPLGQASSSNSLPFVSAGVPYTSLSIDAAVDGRPYRNVSIFAMTAASLAYTIMYSPDGDTWFAYPYTFGSTAGLGISLAGGFFYKITSGTGGSFFYSFS